MVDSGYYTRDMAHFDMCSPQGSARGIFSLKFSDLPASEYSHLLHGFADEQDFEEFKQDLKDFQRLKRERCCRVVDDNDDAREELIDLTELQFICKPNFVCRNRRGYAGRRAKQCHRVQGIVGKSPSPVVVQAGLNTADSTSYRKHRTSWKGGCLQELSNPLATDRPGSLCRTAVSPLGCNGSDDLELSISDILVAFLNEDEHFLEFEQVFEAVRNRRISRDIDCQLSNLGIGRRMSSDIDTWFRTSSATGSVPRTKLDSSGGDNSTKNIQQPSFVSDVFADFFDRDDSFVEFEKEFEKFRSGRRSYLMESGQDLGSTSNVLSDLSVSCGKDLRSHTSNGSYFKNDVDSYRSFLCSGKDWTKMMRKIRRNSYLSMDSVSDQRFSRHRHSVGDVSADDKRTEEQHKSHSMSDLRLIHRHIQSPLSSQELISQNETPDLKLVISSLNIQSLSHGNQDVIPPDPDLSRQSSVTPTGDESSFTDSFDNGKGTSSGHWSAGSEDHSRSSSPGHDCSSSCFCQSDLFIEEAGDTPQADRPALPPSRVRSFSLIELGSRSPATDYRLHTNSLDSLNHRKRFHRSGSSLSDSLRGGISRRSTFCFVEGDTDESLSVSSPSASCSHLSDVDSEHYHTATSDLSWGYSTAKSNLSHLIDRLESAVIDHRVRFGLSDPPTVDTDSFLSEYTFDQPETQERRSVAVDDFSRYHSDDDCTLRRDKRPRSAPACQYTCHEHCVPAVTLSCKSVSGDGCDVAATRTPSPPDPRFHGEAALFRGNNQARPGAARIVPANTADTPPTGTARTSESTPNFQHLAQGRGHMDTPRPANIPIHNRSWSISEDIVTPHSYPIQHPGVGSDPARHSSPAPPPTSSPPCQPSRFDSFPRGNTPGLSQPHAGAPLTESHGVGEGIILSQHARGADRPGGHAAALDLSEVHRRDEDTSPEAATEKDETDSGYRSGTIPDDKLPRVPSQATLDQQELQRKAAKFNHFVPAACLEVTGKESFQGFLKVTMNLVRPITMELGARPPSIYELLTREHIVEESTQQVAFYMPRDTHKSLHITSDTTTKEVIASLLKKFHILDHPRKFAMYEQEFSDRNKLVRLRRLTDKDFPLRCLVTWDPERIKNYRMVLQENETGEIVWDAFSLPELNNFLRVLDREEKETVIDLKYKYAYMKQYMERRLIELRGECSKKSKSKT